MLLSKVDSEMVNNLLDYYSYGAYWNLLGLEDPTSWFVILCGFSKQTNKTWEIFYTMFYQGEFSPVHYFIHYCKSDVF